MEALLGPARLLSFAYALMQSGLANELVLVDADAPRAEGEAMDLNHTVPFTHPTRVWAGDYTDCAGAAVTVVIVAVRAGTSVAAAWQGHTACRRCSLTGRPFSSSLRLGRSGLGFRGGVGRGFGLRAEAFRAKTRPLFGGQGRGPPGCGRRI